MVHFKNDKFKERQLFNISCPEGPCIRIPKKAPMGNIIRLQKKYGRLSWAIERT